MTGHQLIRTDATKARSWEALTKNQVLTLQQVNCKAFYRVLQTGKHSRGNTCALGDFMSCGIYQPIKGIWGILMSTEYGFFQQVRRPLLFLCGRGIDSEDTAQELFEAEPHLLHWNKCVGSENAHQEGHCLCKRLGCLNSLSTGTMTFSLFLPRTQHSACVQQLLNKYLLNK